MATKSLQATIFGVDKASPVFDKVGRSATDLAGDMERSGDRMGKAFQKGAQMAAGALAAIGFGKFVKDSVQQASDLQQSVGKSGVIFDESAAEMDAWAKTAYKSVGLSEQAALEASSSFGDMFAQIGFTGARVVDMSKDVVQLAGDLGSFNNLTTGDVLERIAGAMRGEYDALQKVIPNISAARVQQEAMAESGKTNASALTAQEKAAATLAIIHQDGARASGDFVKNIDQLANAQQSATAQFQNAQAEIGEKLLPIVTDLTNFAAEDLVPILGALADALGVVIDVVDAIPGPVKVAVAALAGFKLFQQSRVFESLASSARGFRDEMTLQRGLAAAQGVELSQMGAAAATAQTRLSGLTGVLSRGAALGAAIVAVDQLTAAWDRQHAMLLDVNTLVDQNTGLLIANSDASIAASLAKYRDTFTQAGVSVTEMVSAVKAGGPELDAVLSKLGAFKDRTAALSSGPIESVVAQFNGTNSTISQTDELMHALQNTSSNLSDSQKTLAEATGANAASTVQAAIAAGTYRDAQDGARAALVERTSAAELAAANASQLAQWQDEERSGASALAAEWDKTTVAVKSFTQAALEAQGVDVAFSQAVSDVYASAQDLADGMRDAEEASRKSGEALFDTAGDLDLTSAAGRDLAASMGQYRDDALSAVEATYRHVAATGDLEGAVAAARAAADQQRAGFVAMATTIMGMSVPAAEAIADKLGFIQGIRIDDKTFSLNAVDNATPVLARVLSLMEQLQDPRMARQSASEWAALADSAFNKIALGVTPSASTSSGGSGGGSGGGKSAAQKAAEKAQKDAQKSADDAARREQTRQEALARTVEGTFDRIGKSVQKPFDVAEFGIRGVESQLARSQRSLENALAHGLDPRKADALRKELADLGAEAQRQLGSLRLKILTADIDNFEASLTDSVDAMHREMQQLEKDMRAAGASSATLSRVGALETYLATAMTRRTEVTKELEQAQSALNAVMEQYRQRVDAVTQTWVKFASVTSVQGTDGWGMAVSAEGIINQLEDRLRVEEQFSKDMEKLRTSGLNQATWQQMMDAGPAAAAQASSLASATDAELRKINALQSAVFGTGTKMGSLSAEWMYRSGINAAQAVVDGLISEQQQLQDTIANLSGGVEILTADEMKRQGVSAADGVIAGLDSRKAALVSKMEELGKSMTAAFKKTLDINSPSGVMNREVGVPVVDGVIAGMRRRSPALQDAIAGMRGILTGGPGGINVGQASAASTSAPTAYIAKVILAGDGEITDAMARTARVELVEWDAARTDLQRRGSTVALR